MGLTLNGGAPTPNPPYPARCAHTALEALRAFALSCVGIPVIPRNGLVVSSQAHSTRPSHHPKSLQPMHCVEGPYRCRWEPLCRAPYQRRAAHLLLTQMLIKPLTFPPHARVNTAPTQAGNTTVQNQPDPGHVQSQNQPQPGNIQLQNQPQPGIMNL